MEYDILISLVQGKLPTREEINQALYEVCEHEHASCSGGACPVLLLNGGKAPGQDKPFDTNRGCDCFKNGERMFQFIKRKKSRPGTLFGIGNSENTRCVTEASSDQLEKLIELGYVGYRVPRLEKAYYCDYVIIDDDTIRDVVGFIMNNDKLDSLIGTVE